MGTPIGDPSVPGTADAGASCSNCWGSGKPFGDGDTPDKIKISLSGINKGPNWTSLYGDPLEGEFELEQVGVLPCTFSLLDPPIGIKVEFKASETEVFVENLGISIYFSAVSATACDTFMLNEENDIFTGGSALLLIPEVE